MVGAGVGVIVETSVFSKIGVWEAVGFVTLSVGIPALGGITCEVHAAKTTHDMVITSSVNIDFNIRKSLILVTSTYSAKFFANLIGNLNKLQISTSGC
jgi:hypothetical protein